MTAVEFTIPGRIVSSNRVTRHRGLIKYQAGSPQALAIAYRPKEVDADLARIRDYAIAAKAAAGWRVPDLAEVAIFAYNSGLDVGNIDKVPLDAIKGGVLIVDDNKKHLRSCLVTHMPDDIGGERYVVKVTAVYEALPL